ncbi:L-threonine 3-O-phosphate decarboxylase, partial [hydrothermal vent metagenome]
VHQGDVIVPPHTFGEYAAAASRAHRRTVETSWDSWNQPLVPGSVEFLCIPNNPTGYELSSEEVRRRVDARSIAGSQVVLDLAYAPFLDHKVLVPEEAIVLYSPNKVHGMTGIRAAFLVAPLAAAQRLAHAAPSWVTGAHGVAMLAAIYHNEAQAWVESTTAKLRQERLLLTQSLIRAGFEVKESGANFLMIRVGDAALVRSTLLSQGIHVRDCSSFGLPEWIRVSAGKSERNTALVAAMCSLREDDMWAH